MGLAEATFCVGVDDGGTDARLVVLKLRESEAYADGFILDACQTGNSNTLEHGHIDNEERTARNWHGTEPSVDARAIEPKAVLPRMTLIYPCKDLALSLSTSRSDDVG